MGGVSDCPLCEWRYDPYAAAICAYPVGSRLAPIVWDGARLRVAQGSEAPNGRHCAAGIHMVEEHPLDPRVVILGPWERHAPLAEFNPSGSRRSWRAR
jgi:hypothetical protein